MKHGSTHASSDARGPYAALDLGTNTFLMAIGRRAPNGGLEMLDDRCRTPRLGAGLASSGRLSSVAMEGGLAVLAEFAAILNELAIPAEHVRTVGTAALRRAANAAEFVAAARARTGFEIEVIAEEDEARLSFEAVVAESASDDIVIIDVGGGSTEVAWDRGRSRKSMPLGAVVLTERGQGNFDGLAWSDSAWSQLLREVEVGSQVFPAQFATRAEGPTPEVVVVGGTSLNLACLVHGFARFDPTAAESRRATTDDAGAWAERLRRLDSPKRLEFPVENERATILPAGLACLAAVLARGGATGFRATGRGLRHGVLRELIGLHSAPRS